MWETLSDTLALCQNNEVLTEETGGAVINLLSTYLQAPGKSRFDFRKKDFTFILGTQAQLSVCTSRLFFVSPLG